MREMVRRTRGAPPGAGPAPPGKSTGCVATHRRHRCRPAGASNRTGELRSADPRRRFPPQPGPRNPVRADQGRYGGHGTNSPCPKSPDEATPDGQERVVLCEPVHAARATGTEATGSGHLRALSVAAGIPRERSSDWSASCGCPGPHLLGFGPWRGRLSPHRIAGTCPPRGLTVNLRPTGALPSRRHTRSEPDDERFALNAIAA